MKVKFDEIEEGFFYVSMERPYINSAFLSKETGQVDCTSEMWDSEELPEDIDSGDYIEIPHMSDLDLGVRLVRDFVFSRIRGAR